MSSKTLTKTMSNKIKTLPSIACVVGVLLVGPASKADLPPAPFAYPPLASFAILQTSQSSPAGMISVNDAGDGVTGGGGFGHASNRANNGASNGESNEESNLEFVTRNHILIIADDERLFRAMRLLRFDGQSRYSVALAKLAERHRPSSQTPAVLYELALAYFALEDCKKVRRLLARFTDKSASDTTSDAASNGGGGGGRVASIEEVVGELEVLGEACDARERVRFDWETASSFGYDSNLANTRGRYAVTLETGSQLHNIIYEIIGVGNRGSGFGSNGRNEGGGFGGIDIESILLGTAKVEGWFVEQNFIASLKRQVNRRHNRMDVGGFYRSTQPLGYDRKGAHFNLGWHTPLGGGETRNALFENRLSAQMFVQGQGRHRPSLVQNSLRLAQNLYLRPSAIMTAIVQAHARTSSSPRIPASGVDEFSGRITLITSTPSHAGTGSGILSRLKGWRMGLYHTSRYAVQPHNSARVYGVDGEVHCGYDGQYVVRFGRGHEHLAAPRPWAVGAPTITHVYAGLGVYPFGVDSPWRVDGRWNHSTSPDAHDRQSDWQVAVHYQWS